MSIRYWGKNENGEGLCQFSIASEFVIYKLLSKLTLDKRRRVMIRIINNTAYYVSRR